VPTILARCSEGCTGFINALFFFAVAFAIYVSKLSLPPQSLTCGIVTDQVADVRKRNGLSESRLLFWGDAERLGEFRKPKTMSPSGLTVLVSFAVVLMSESSPTGITDDTAVLNESGAEIAVLHSRPRIRWTSLVSGRL
jgi:hypothetical protein